MSFYVKDLSILGVWYLQGVPETNVQRIPRDDCTDNVPSKLYANHFLYEARNPLFVSPGYTEEALYFYVFQLHSDTVSPQTLHLDEGEELVGAWFPIDEIFSNHRPHISYDLKTVFCFLLWKSLNS